MNAQRRARGEPELDAVHVLRLVREKAKALNVSEEMLKRALNVGFSGGEKKRLEILQMALFEPQLAILDETDSGLDIDALKIVAEGVNALRSPDRAMLVITHYQRLLDYIVPDRVHVLAKGRIVARRRQGTGARARSQGLRRHREGRGMSVVRRHPLEIFRAKGIPHRRMEDWKYTDLRAVLDARDDRACTAPRNGRSRLPAGVETCSIWSNGRRCREWVMRRIGTSSETIGAMDAAARALRSAASRFRVAAGCADRGAAEARSSSAGHMQRRCWSWKSGASLTLVETHHVRGRGPPQCLAFEMFLEEGAQLTHVREAQVRRRARVGRDDLRRPGKRLASIARAS